MDARDGRIVTSRARSDVEEAYDDEQSGGGKGYLGLYLGWHPFHLDVSWTMLITFNYML